MTEITIENIKITIRNFQPGDYDALISLWRECGLPYKPGGRDSRDKVLNEITGETADLLVAESEGKLIATILATHDGRKGWINRLAVVSSFRHKGIARQLVRLAEEALYKKGIEIIACLIEEGNTVSMDFFQQAGYRKHTDIFYFSKRKHPGV